MDQNGQLNLTPFMFTLCILNTKTRKSANAWEKLYFHPDHDYVQISHTHKFSPLESLKNFHCALFSDLESFKDTFKNGGTRWNKLK